MRLSGCRSAPAVRHPTQPALCTLRSAAACRAAAARRAVARRASISGYATSHRYATALGDASAKKPENGNKVAALVATKKMNGDQSILATYCSMDGQVSFIVADMVSILDF